MIISIEGTSEAGKPPILEVKDLKKHFLIKAGLFGSHPS